MSQRRLLSILIACAFSSISSVTIAAEAKPVDATGKLRVGIIGLDTSHVVAFTKAVNNPKAEGPLATMAIVAAFPGGSPDIPASADRVEGFTKTLRDSGVEIVDSIEALLPKVDAVLLESVDGRPHLEQVKPVLKARKPVFIDKPVAGSLADAVEIFRLAKEAGVPCFSSSSLRFSPDVAQIRQAARSSDVKQVEATSPCSLEPHHPDLFWYGVHGVETLYAIMGPGCVSVTREHSDELDVVTGVWRDGRIGASPGARQAKGPAYTATIVGPQGPAVTKIRTGYEPLLVEIGKFFQTGKPPVAAEETIELFAFMEAADESKRQGGKSVTLESVLKKAATK